jgi:hypothetical protein
MGTVSARISKGVPMKHETEPEIMPSLITLDEFLRSKSKTIQIETMGSFSYWIKKRGCPKKWSLVRWESALKEFLERVV